MGNIKEGFILLLLAGTTSDFGSTNCSGRFSPKKEKTCHFFFVWSAPQISHLNELDAEGNWIFTRNSRTAFMQKSIMGTYPYSAPKFACFPHWKISADSVQKMRKIKSLVFVRKPHWRIGRGLAPMNGVNLPPDKIHGRKSAVWIAPLGFTQSILNPPAVFDAVF